MLNQIKSQLDDQLKKSLDTQKKVFELSTDFASGTANRSQEFLKSLIQTGVDNTQNLTNLRDPKAAIEQQLEFANQLRSQVEEYVQANYEALNEFGQAMGDLGKSHVQGGAEEGGVQFDLAEPEVTEEADVADVTAIKAEETSAEETDKA